MKLINNLIFRTGYRCEKDPTGELDRKEKKEKKLGQALSKEIPCNQILSGISNIRLVCEQIEYVNIIITH